MEFISLPAAELRARGWTPHEFANDWDTVMEVFRLEGGRISEHWEAIEPWDFLELTSRSADRIEATA